MAVQQIDLRILVLYTQLRELWDIFKKIISISPVNDTGFTLINAGVYLKGYNYEQLQVTHQEFWDLMEHFLKRINEKFLERKRLHREELKRKSKI